MTTVRDVRITHPDRIVYPEVGLSKLDVARYIDRVAPLMLPHVAGRPLVFYRCPEGIARGCFYQKHWTGRLPKALRTVPIKQANGATRHYVVADDPEGLVTLIQWNIVEIHVWGARSDNLEAPDRMIFDLDPGPGVAWEIVRDCGRALRDTLDRVGLQSWVKTSGGKGIHIVIPIQRRSTWSDVGNFGKSIAREVERQRPDVFTTEAALDARPGKVYIDWLRNARGASYVAPWSMRARHDAGVSLPISWRQFEKISAGNEATISSIGRSGKLDDPWKDITSVRQYLSRDVLTRFDGSVQPRRRRPTTRSSGR